MLRWLDAFGHEQHLYGAPAHVLRLPADLASICRAVIGVNTRGVRRTADRCHTGLVTRAGGHRLFTSNDREPAGIARSHRSFEIVNPVAAQ